MAREPKYVNVYRNMSTGQMTTWWSCVQLWIEYAKQTHSMLKVEVMDINHSLTDDVLIYDYTHHYARV